MITLRVLRTTALLSTLCAIGSGHVPHAQSQEPSSERPMSERQALKPENFSPLGFEDLRAYQQAFPGAPAAARSPRRAATKYWVFRGIAYRGRRAARPGVGEPRARDEHQVRAQAARTISPAASRRWRSRRPAGATAAAACGSAPPAAASGAPTTRCTPTMPAGAGSAQGSAPTTSAASRSIRTTRAATRSTSAPAKRTRRNNSGAGTGLYRSTDGGDRWTRIPTIILDPAVSPSPIDFTSTRGISTVVVEPGNPQTIYVATTTAMLGMTAVRGGQTQTTGYPQPRVGLYKTDNGGDDAGRCSGCRRSIP